MLLFSVCGLCWWLMEWWTDNGIIFGGFVVEVLATGELTVNPWPLQWQIDWGWWSLVTFSAISGQIFHRANIPRANILGSLWNILRTVADDWLWRSPYWGGPGVVVSRGRQCSLRVTGHFSTPPENWTVRAFLQLTPRLSNDLTAAWLTFTFRQLFAVAATLKSIDYNVAMTFILNNNNNNCKTVTKTVTYYSTYNRTITRFIAR